jgi:hypothetical protein
VTADAVDGGTNFTRHATDVFPFGMTGNSHIYYAEYAGSMTYNLPAEPETKSGTGKVFCVRNLVAQVIELNPDDADYIEYDTTGPIAVGEAIVSTGAIGEYVCVQGMDDGSNDYWVTFGINGTWAEETP